MQPIVENFFKHNFQNDDKLKVIVISGRRRSDGILFQFFDNIGHISDEQIVILNQQFTPEKIEASRETASGIGLQNVYDRLYLYYGNRVEMRIQNHAPSGVCIQILLKDEVTN
jgi:two-component system sensor histidine kinase YesM